MEASEVRPNWPHFTAPQNVQNASDISCETERQAEGLSGFHSNSTCSTKAFSGLKTNNETDDIIALCLVLLRRLWATVANVRLGTVVVARRSPYSALSWAAIGWRIQPEYEVPDVYALLYAYVLPE